MRRALARRIFIDLVLVEEDQLQTNDGTNWDVSYAFIRGGTGGQVAFIYEDEKKKVYADGRIEARAMAGRRVSIPLFGAVDIATKAQKCILIFQKNGTRDRSLDLYRRKESIR